MGNLYNTINELCESRGIKGAKMCAEAGISKGLLTDLKMGRRTGVSAVTAQKIASYFGVSVAYLLGEEEKEKPTSHQVGELSEEELEIIADLRRLADADHSAILRMIKSLSGSDEK